MNKIPTIELFISVNQGTAAAPGAGVKIIRFAQPPVPTVPGKPGQPPTVLPGVNASLFSGGQGAVGVELNNVNPELAASLTEGKRARLVLVLEGEPGYDEAGKADPLA